MMQDIWGQLCGQLARFAGHALAAQFNSGAQRMVQNAIDEEAS
jgi:hypothetical protein